MKCPICNATVPFSMAMHMIAAHGRQPMKETITRFSAKEEKAKKARQARGGKGWRRHSKGGSGKPKRSSGGHFGS